LRSAFLALLSPSDVADLLEVPFKTLCFYLSKKKNYQQFLIARACGTPRIISAPITPLKIIQRKLAQVLYAVYGSRSVVHGFAKGKSIKSNATRHLGAEWILNFDLQDFFPSIHFGRVLGLFAGKPYNLPREVAVTLARICCHEGSLPIGAPTSPITANLICAKMDSELKALAWSCSCIYTRYADDISISTKAVNIDKRIVEKNLSKRQWEMSSEILEIVQHNSFKINSAKTRVRGRQSSLEITGLRINSGLNVSRRFYRQVRAMLHAWEKFGEDAAQNEHRSKYKDKQYVAGSPAFRDVLRGKIEFIGFIRGRDDRIYVSLLQRIQKLAALKAKPILIGHSTHESVMRQAIWLLMDKSENEQGTAFAVEGNRLLTAAHNTNQIMWASRPDYDNQKYLVEIVQRNNELDIAEIKISPFLPVQFAFAPSDAINLKTSICVVGFPNYHDKDSVAFRFGKIVQERHYISIKHDDPKEHVLVKHYIVDADIVKATVVVLFLMKKIG
jgi:RNA-directed DNA polymerase